VTIELLLEDLKQRGVELWVEADKLRFRAPQGALTPELRDVLTARKAEVVGALRSSMPLSYAQSRLWFFERLSPGTALMHICFELRLHGTLDAGALERALDLVQQRHDVLRTVFRLKGRDPVQVVVPAPPFVLPRHDIETNPSDIERIAADLAHRPFDLSNGPLWRAALVRIGPQEHLLALVLHHLVFDGTSVRIFLRELAAFYAASTHATTPSLPKLTWQYGDFCAWERKALEGSEAEPSLQYWRSRLVGPLPVLELPTDHARPVAQTYRGDRVTVTLQPELVTELQGVGRAHGATLFMVVLAAFKALLCRLTGQQDVIVGAPMAGRLKHEIENLLGVFINTLPLRTDLSGDPTFEELVRRVRATALEAYEHQAVPFDRIVADLHPGRGLSQSPVFQILFNMQEVGGAYAFDLGGLRAEVEGRLDVGSKFDLTVYATHQREGLNLTFVYNADLFTASRMTHLLEQYCSILKAAAADRQQQLSRLPLETAAGRQALPDPAMPLGRVVGESILSRLRQHARRTPNAVAVTDATGSLSYRELERRADALAAEIAGLGIQPGEVVAVYAHRSRSLVVALTAILKSGAAFAILDPAQPARRLVECLERAQPRLWLRVAEAPREDVVLDEYVASQGLPTLVVSSATEPVEGSQIVAVQEDPDRLAYVAFTSGSTGGVKAVAGTERPLRHFLDWHCRTFGITAADTVSMLSGLAHDPLLRDVFTPLWVGGRLAIPDPDALRQPVPLAQFMARENVSIAHITPAAATLLVSGAEGQRPLTSLRRMFFGGDRLTHQIVEAMRRIAPDVRCVNYYGATETPQGVAFWTDGDDVPNGEEHAHGSHALPIGIGIDSVQLLVLTPAGRLAGVGEPGEICVRTPYLSRGYLGDEELTRQRFVRNPFGSDPDDFMYRTGDLGRYTPGGAVEFMGRTDYQVKIRGYRVELQAIESALLQVPSVAAAVVIATQAPHGDDELVAYWVPKSVCGEDGLDLRAHLRRTLPDYMVPSWFVPMASLPQTPNGKIDRRALPPPDRTAEEARVVRTETGEAAVTPVEDMLLGIWADVLGVKTVRRHDDFFELGGHSLLAARLMQQLSEIFWIELPLRTLFESPTVAALAPIILERLEAKRLQEVRTDSSVLVLNERGARPPFFFLHAAMQGDGFYCYNLARHLGEDQPMYGLAPLGLDGTPVPPTVELMAAAQRKIIRKLQPAGPYYLGGFCISGVVALEVARQLRAEGERVELVAIIETRVHPPILLNRLANAVAAIAARLKRAPIQYELAVAGLLRPYVYAVARLYHAPPDETFRRVGNGLWRVATAGPQLVRRLLGRRRLQLAPPPAPDLLSDPVRAAVLRANRLASHAYLPRRYKGRVICMWAEAEPFEPRTWQMAVRDLQLQPVAGNHNTCITTQIDSLGGLLSKALCAAQEAAAVPTPATATFGRPPVGADRVPSGAEKNSRAPSSGGLEIRPRKAFLR
jgi:amino acid adenylation domain-containing protein